MSLIHIFLLEDDTFYLHYRRYEQQLESIMYHYTAHHRDPLSELEVFSGNILGKDGGLSSRRVRQDNRGMKEEFNRQVYEIIQWMTDSAEDEVQSIETFGIDNDTLHLGSGVALERSLACLHLGLSEPGKHVRTVGPLHSFVYVAAAVCLSEVEKFRAANKGRNGLTQLLSF